MHINFTSIKLHNFLSFADATIDFDKKGFIMVSGTNLNPVDNAQSNGSGKSSIWEAISWCITGETIRGTTNVKRIGSEDKCEVALDFTIDSNRYKIVRTKDPSNLFVYINDENKSGKGIRDTNKILSEILPDLTSQLIGSVIILGQGLPQRFTNNTPSGRKEVLEKLSKSDFMIADLKDKIAERKLELDKETRQYEDSLISLNTKKSYLSSQILDTERKLSQLEDAKVLQDALVKYTSDEQVYGEKLEQSKKDYYEKSEQLSQLKKDYSDLQIQESTEKLNVEKQLTAEANPIYLRQVEISASIKNIKNEILRLESIKDVCPTCGQKLPNVHKPDTTKQKEELNSLNEELSAVNASINEATKKKSSLMESIENEYKEKKSLSAKSVNSCTAELNNMQGQVNHDTMLYNQAKENRIVTESKLSNLETQKTTYLEDIKKYKESVKEVEESIRATSEKIDSVKTHLDVVNKMDTVIKRDFRGILLSNLINFINTKCKEYCRYVYETDRIEFCLDGNNIEISYDGKDYENLSSGEKQRIDLIVQFSIRDMLCKCLNFSSNIIVLDEITDGLDSYCCEKVMNLISSQLMDVESVYIITHHKDLQLPCDDEINIVKKEDGISYVM